MTVILTAVGMFYMLAAAMVLRRARMEWTLDRAIEKMTGKPEPDGDRIWFMTSSAAVFGGAGLALVLRSGWAVWLLGAGLTVQAVYYTLVAPQLQPKDGGDPARWRKAWNAGMVSAAAFALAAYGLRIGALA